MRMHLWLLWTARISGLLVTAFFATFFIGEGIPDIAAGRGDGLIRFLPFTALSFAGYLVAWFKPAIGGRMLMGGALLLGGYFLFRSELNMALAFGLPSLLVGLCFMAAANKQLV